MTDGRPPAPSFELLAWRGSAARFHARPLADDAAHQVRRQVWSFAVDAPAIVLGSRQGHGELDLAACRAAGVDVVHRRSGGGAVLLRPDEIVWLDVIVPSDDPLFLADVTHSMRWIGERWADALSSLGVADVEVHRHKSDGSPISDRLCFAGLAVGEVAVGGAKLVGISQRRTRVGARFQCAVHTRWDAEASISLLAPPHPDVDALPPVAELPPPLAAELPAALTTALTR